MIRDEFVMDKFKALPPEEREDVLLRALDLMSKSDYKNKVDCISLAMGIPLFPRIMSIENIDGYNITVRFDNDEERSIDFSRLFSAKKPFQKVLLESYEQFKKVTILEDTLAWPEIGEWSLDLNGNKVFEYYDIDPGLLYENSVLVEYKDAF